MISLDIVDLFAGAGGTSTGLVQAASNETKNLKLTAINHNKKALETHKANFPWATHILTELQSVDPYEVAPEGALDGLVASPECTFFSRARGGKPIRPQDRASPWYLGRWMKKLDIPWILIENVPEIIQWGPLDQSGRPMKAQAGSYFRLWLNSFRKNGYEIEYKVLNAADYGDVTSRRRFFAIARKDGHPISWPEQTHMRKPTGNEKKWRAAREIIDFSIKGESIFSRKRPLAENTMKRIIAGLEKFGKVEPSPFIVLLEHSLLSPENRIRDIDLPLPTITGAKGGAIAIAEPYLTIYHGGRERTKSINDPLPTLDTSNRIALAEPYLIEYYGRGKARSIEGPIPTITTKDRLALIQPITIEGKEYSIDILYRMLKPKELAAAMGFPETYQFKGNQQDQVRQIGNAVAVNMAKSLISSLLNPGKANALGAFT